MDQGAGGGGRPLDTARATLARLLAAGRTSGAGTGGASAYAQSQHAAAHGGAPAAAAAAPGVDPHSFGHDRAADEITTRVEADALYDVFNPTGFVKEWTVKQKWLDG